MRDRVTDIGPGLLEEDVFDVGNDGAAEDRVQLRSHLLEQRGYRPILLDLRGIVQFSDVVALRSEYMPNRSFQQWRQYVEATDEVATEKASQTAAVGHD